MVKCLCGRPATHKGWLPMPNIFAGIKEVMEEHLLCDYHASKAEKLGYIVEFIGTQIN